MRNAVLHCYRITYYNYCGKTCGTVFARYFRVWELKAVTQYYNMIIYNITSQRIVVVHTVLFKCIFRINICNPIPY